MLNLIKTSFYNDRNKLNFIIWLIYICLLCFASYYHQPWHDEGQAWLIARDDSIWQLLTVTTHYEGHPPLWHLALMPFAKLGVPFLFGLKAVNIFFCALAMGFLIFKSPLPWYLRLPLPFTYFMFYQYGVLNRVYSLLMLAIMLVAYYYPQRKQQPYKLALTLALAAGSQAYGMMFACGVALVWLIEVLRRDKFELNKVKDVWQQSKEVRALGLLFVLALCLGLCILPFSDTEFTSSGAKTGFWENLFYFFAVMPGQFLLSNDMQSNFTANIMVFFYANLRICVDMVTTNGIYGVLLLVQLLAYYAYGIFLNLGVGYICWRSRMLSLFLCPLVLMNLLGALVYWNIYHTGIWVCFYVFILWQLWSDKDKLEMVVKELKTKFTYPWEYTFVKGGMAIFWLAVLVTNYYWSGAASKNNYLNDTDASAQIANFIKANNLMKCKFWITPKFNEDGNKHSNYVIAGNFAINCYFQQNIIQNLDGGNTAYAYHEYRLLPEDKYITQVQAFGPPSFILGKDTKLKYVFANPPEYIPIKEFSAASIWKDTISISHICLYMREDLTASFPQFEKIHIISESETDY